tara:strand:+ start:336 stop:536 length:201 start_codon:yes stop_codon:yes gene_type:complete
MKPVEKRNKKLNKNELKLLNVNKLKILYKINTVSNENESIVNFDTKKSLLKDRFTFSSLSINPLKV